MKVFQGGFQMINKTQFWYDVVGLVKGKLFPAQHHFWLAVHQLAGRFGSAFADEILNVIIISFEHWNSSLLILSFAHLSHLVCLILFNPWINFVFTLFIEFLIQIAIYILLDDFYHL